MTAPDIPPLVPPGAEFEFGQSPFRVKGTLYAGTQSFFNETVDGGLDALLNTIGEGPLADFIGGKFLPSGLYDVMPVPALIACEARTLKLDVDTYLARRTEWQAKQDINGIYRFLLRLVSPDAVATRLPKVLTQMFDFPSFVCNKTEPRDWMVEFHDIPLALHDWLASSFDFYTKTTLSLAGAKEVNLEHRPRTFDSKRAGVELWAIIRRVTWT